MSQNPFYGTDRQDRSIELPWWRRRRIHLIGAVAAAVVVVLALVAMLRHVAGAQTSVDRSRLTIATVERGLFVRDLEADGQVVAAVSPTLYAPATGTVSLKVHAGDAVRRGQVLIVLDSPDLMANFKQEQASLTSMRLDWQRAQLDASSKLAQLQESYKQAQVDQTTDQRELDRSRQAYKLGSYTELQMLKAQDELEKAQFALQEAKENLDLQPAQNRFDIGSKRALFERQQDLVADLQRQVDLLQIRSPVDGRVGQVQIEDRATVAKDTALITVVDLSALEVEINVPESQARDLAPGMSADIEGDGQHWPGSVSAVSPEVVNGEVVARVRFGDAKPEGLRQSQRMSVRILIDRRPNVLMVDRGTFMDQDGGGFAYLVRGNIAQRVPVRLGAASVQKVEVLDGLSAGDQIVVSGTDEFNNADRVILAE
ncbi:MAG TPA: efflux RND transporter periplasmic adaptor subunit [Steroidobacteraceae bacterium]|nr:efflux RND transporter periplasmic adaptor subunit [Steroidobacteraceae bacterium]